MTPNRIAQDIIMRMRRRQNFSAVAVAIGVGGGGYKLDPNRVSLLVTGDLIYNFQHVKSHRIK